MWYTSSMKIKRENMTNQDALSMVWHMANMWLTEGSQRFQYNPETNQMDDCLTDLLETHYPQNTEADAEKALQTVLVQTVLATVREFPQDN